MFKRLYLLMHYSLILFKMTPLESSRRELSSCSIYTNIRPVVSEILSFANDIFGFLEGDDKVGFCSK